MLTQINGTKTLTTMTRGGGGGGGWGGASGHDAMYNSMSCSCSHPGCYRSSSGISCLTSFDLIPHVVDNLWLAWFVRYQCVFIAPPRRTVLSVTNFCVLNVWARNDSATHFTTTIPQSSERDTQTTIRHAGIERPSKNKLGPPLISSEIWNINLSFYSHVRFWTVCIVLKSLTRPITFLHVSRKPWPTHT